MPFEWEKYIKFKIRVEKYHESALYSSKEWSDIYIYIYIYIIYNISSTLKIVFI